MFEKKKGMSDSEKKAKLAALKEAHGMASGMMKEGLDGAKKVSVMADSKEGLKKGLDVAEQVIGEDLGEDEADHDREDTESALEDAQDGAAPMSEDEIDAKIKELLELKEQLK
jgi:hypothetical protein